MTFTLLPGGGGHPDQVRPNSVRVERRPGETDQQLCNRAERVARGVAATTRLAKDLDPDVERVVFLTATETSLLVNFLRGSEDRLLRERGEEIHQQFQRRAHPSMADLMFRLPGPLDDCDPHGLPRPGAS